MSCRDYWSATETSHGCDEMSGMRAAFFDLDKTVIAKASIGAFGRPLYRGGLINRRLVARAIVSQVIYLHLGASEQKLARVRERCSP